MNKHIFFIPFTILLFISLISRPTSDMLYFVLLIFLFIVTYLIYKIYFLERQLETEQKAKLDIKQIKDSTVIAKQNFFNLANNIKSGVLSFNEFGHIIYTNKSFPKIFGFVTEENSRIVDISHNELKKIIVHAYGRESYVDNTLEIGSEHYRVTVNPIFTKSGEYTGGLLLATNVSSIIKTKVIQKAFIADVSHELKTPISSIKLANELLYKNENLSSEEREEIFEIVTKEITRTENLVKDILDLSKLDRLDFKLVLDNADLKDIISEAVSQLNVSALEKNIVIKDSSQSHVLRVDSARIKQVLLNLLKNAITYTDEGNIYVFTREVKRHVEIVVEDTGIGIKKEDLDLIFERFYRVDKNRSRKTGGSGLGLPICSEIISKHNGTLLVKSKLGKGSRFIITLPLDYIGEY